MASGILIYASQGLNICQLDLDALVMMGYGGVASSRRIETHKEGELYVLFQALVFTGRFWGRAPQIDLRARFQALTPERVPQASQRAPGRARTGRAL